MKRALNVTKGFKMGGAIVLLFSCLVVNALSGSLDELKEFITNRPTI